MNAGPVLWPFTFWRPVYQGRRRAGRSRYRVLAYPGAVWGSAFGLRGVLVPTGPVRSTGFHFVPFDDAARRKAYGRAYPPRRHERAPA